MLDKNKEAGLDNEKDLNTFVIYNQYPSNTTFIIVVLVCFIIFTGYSFNLYDTSAACKDRWSGSNYGFKHTSESGCLIKINNVWVKEDNIKFSLPNISIKK